MDQPVSTPVTRIVPRTYEGARASDSGQHLLAEEFTVDELAARAQMTVRNLRAYASRGLIDAPRLEGRAGFYSVKHLLPIASQVTLGMFWAQLQEAIDRELDTKITSLGSDGKKRRS